MEKVLNRPYRKFVLVLLVGFSTFFRLDAASSDKVTYQCPLRIPVSLSGNYAELRSGRFHAGIDFRAYGKVGDPIYAAAAGYIARVTVGASGYGNGIYLTHPDGSQTVYGHLSRFVAAVADSVRSAQYEKQQFAVDLAFEPDWFPVEAGTLIGYVGNSGSSGAPHLHFEIRRPDQSGPLNPLRAGVVRVEDTQSPEISRIAFVGYFEDSAGVAYPKEIASFRYGSSKVLSLPERSYLLVSAVDRQDGTPAKLGIEHYQLWLDDSLLFDYKVGEYLFQENRSFNSLIDYAAKQQGQGNCVKTWIEPGNEYIYRRPQMRPDGLIHLRDDSQHQVRLLLTDEHGNTTERIFRVRRDTAKYRELEQTVVTDTTQGAWTAWFLPRWVEQPDIQLGFFLGSFFRNVRVKVQEQPSQEGVYSKVWKIGDSEVPLKRSVRLRMRVEAPDSLKSKLLLGRLTRKGNWVACGGRVSGDTLRGALSSFGTYGVIADTKAPVVTARFKNGADLRRRTQCAWTIKDDLSGIAHWQVKIDGEWVIGQYDAKYNKLWVDFDPDVVRKGKKHRIEVWVRDARNNVSEHEYEVIW